MCSQVVHLELTGIVQRPAMRGFDISPEPIKARLQQMTTDWTGKMGPLWKAHNQKDF